MEQNKVQSIVHDIKALTKFFLEKPEEYKEERFAEIMLDKNNQPFMLMGRLEGCMIYVVDQGKVGNIGMIFSNYQHGGMHIANYSILDEKYRYKGIGYKALMMYITQLKDHGIQVASLNARERLYEGVDQNVRLYSKLGFVVKGRKNKKDLTPMDLDVTQWQPKQYTTTTNVPQVVREKLEMANQMLEFGMDLGDNLTF